MSETTSPTGIASGDTPNQQAATVGPVQPRERMVVLDVLRGYALLR